LTTSPTRRTVWKSGALTMGALTAPLVRGAYAAGKLRCGFATQGEKLNLTIAAED
jgi:hypothetical protein